MFNSDRRVSFVPPLAEEINIIELQTQHVEEPETTTSGNVSFSDFLSYFAAGGRRCKILFFICICVFTQVLASSGDLWLTHWYD